MVSNNVPQREPKPDAVCDRNMAILDCDERKTPPNLPFTTAL